MRRLLAFTFAIVLFAAVLSELAIGYGRVRRGAGVISFERTREAHTDNYLYDLGMQTRTMLRVGMDDTAGGAAWSPNGDRMVFSSQREGVRRLYLIDFATDRLAPLLPSPALNVDARIAVWSPDGRWLAVYGWQVPPLYLIDMSADPPVVLLATVPRVTYPDVLWSPDSTRLAISSYIDRMPILAYNLPQRQISYLTTSQIGSRTADIRPAWSPDGQQIAFLRISEESTSLYIINTDGTDEHQVSSTQAAPLSPVWIADGQQIVLYAEPNNHTFELVRMHIETGEMVVLSSSDRPSITSAVRISDVHLLVNAYANYSDFGWQPYLIDLNTGETTSIPIGVEGVSNLQWVPW